MESAGEWQRRRELNSSDDLEKCVHRKFSIAITCQKCKRALIVDPEPLLRLYMLRRWDRALIATGQHLKCSKCGTKWPEVRPVDRAPADRPVGITTEADFERIKKRLRR